MADAAEFRAATERHRTLLDVIDQMRFRVSHHEPFAGLDEVLCAGCPTSIPWADCPEIERAVELAALTKVAERERGRPSRNRT
jgi:hypothetical protein